MSEQVRCDRALILAAGLGSRLGDRTAELPKALVPVWGKPILEYQFEALETNGVREICIVLGHAGEAIRSWVSERTRASAHVTFVENPGYARSNSAHSFWLARDFLSGHSYFHLNCDVIFSPSLVGRLCASPHASVIALDRSVALGPGMEQVRLESSRIVEMRNMPFEGAEAKAVGLARFGPIQHSWMTARADDYRRAGDLGRNCFGLIREAVPDQPFHGVEIEDDWLYEVNTPQDLARAESGLAGQGIV